MKQWGPGETDTEIFISLKDLYFKINPLSHYFLMSRSS